MKKKIFSLEYILTGLLIIQAAIFIIFLVYFSSAHCLVNQNLDFSSTCTLKMMESKIALLEQHENWIISFLGIAIAIVAIFLGLLQFYFAKKAEDNVFSGLARIANIDKVAFREAVKMKSIELELMSDYPIYIISDMWETNSKSTKLINMLRGFHFEDVTRITYVDAQKQNFCDSSVLILCDSSKDENKTDKIRKEDKDLLATKIEETPKLGVLGYMIAYKNGTNDLFKDKGCLSFAQFPSQLYNNLMSLLHYKRYLNKQ